MKTVLWNWECLEHGTGIGTGVGIEAAVTQADA